MITPSYKVECVFDYAETVSDESYFSRSREFRGIRPPKDGLVNVIQLASGVWCLKPGNTDLAAQHQETAWHASILTLPQWNAAAPMVELKLQRRFDELTGVSPSIAVAPSGDQYITKRLTASQNWNQALVSTGVVTTLPTMPTTPHYPLDLVLQHSQGPAHTNDQGYLLRWFNPGSKADYIDYVFQFWFGGLLTTTGFGLFSFTASGAGRCYLHEYSFGAWRQVDEWQFGNWAQMPQAKHVVRIIPHALRYIEFKHTTVERPSLAADWLPRVFGGERTADAHVYEIVNRGNIGPFVTGQVNSVSGVGHPQIHWNRSLRGLYLSVALVQYPASGTLRDGAFTVPWRPTNNHALEVKPRFIKRINVASGATETDVTTDLLKLDNSTDPPTETSLTPQNETYTFNGESRTINGWQVPGYPNAVRAKFTLTSNNVNASPWFFGYEVRRRGNVATVANGETLIDATHHRQSPVTQIDIAAQDADPSHASAHLVVSDLTNRCPFLRQRGDVPIKIQMQYDPDPAKRTVLFEGYAAHVDAQRRKVITSGWPSALWHDYRVMAVGKWKRLADRDWAYGIASFLNDDSPNAPTDPQTLQKAPWKVTDIVRFVLLMGGFMESQQDIPDLEMRTWASPGEDMTQIWMIWNGDNLGTYLRKLVFDYLGAYLLWDPNAGSAGMWRLKLSPTGTETPLYTFTLAAADPGRLTVYPGALGHNTTWIQHDTLETYVLPPEGNFLTVTGIDKEQQLIRQEYRNPRSYNRPGENTAVLADPDYLGRIRPITLRPDPLLNSREAVQFVGRRIFEQACRGRIFAHWTSPAVIVETGESVYTTHPGRPLQFGDPVSLNGELYFIRAVNIAIRKQHITMMKVEAEQFRAPLSFS